MSVVNMSDVKKNQRQIVRGKNVIGTNERRQHLRGEDTTCIQYSIFEASPVHDPFCILFDKINVTPIDLFLTIQPKQKRACPCSLNGTKITDTMK